MTKKIKTLIASAAVLILLGGGYYGSIMYNKKKLESFAGDVTPPPKLGNLDGSKLARIDLPNLSLEKNGENWELVSLKDIPLSAEIELDQNVINGYSYALANVFAESVVEESPADISPYGLEHSSARITLSDFSGENAVYIVGDMTPSRSAYYVMQEGDPQVYAVSSSVINSLMFDLGSIRVKTLFPTFELSDLLKLRLESPETKLEIMAISDSLPVYMGMISSPYIVTSPYILQRAVNPEVFEQCIAPLNGLSIKIFVDDDPDSLVPYGLDKPVRLYVETTKGTVNLLIGNPLNGMHYAKTKDAPGVFMLEGLAPLIKASPFSFIDKFALIINIENVDTITITGGKTTLSAELQGTGDEAVFFLNGKKANTKSFRTWYGTVVSLLADAEYPGPARNPALDSSEEITISYELNNPSGAKTAITLIPYDRDYYTLLQEGTMEFLISRNQVRTIFETADTMIFEE
jgi:hypothetical protein